MGGSGGIMEDKEKIEEILKKYPILKSKLNMKLTNLDNLEIPISAISYSHSKSQKTNDFYSDVENYISDKSDLKEDAKKLYRQVKTIESSLECLSTKEYNIIRFKYFEDLTYVEISFEMERSVTTLQKYKDQALEKLKKTELHEICYKCDIKLT